MAFLRLSNSLRNSHGEEVRPKLAPQKSNASEEALTFEDTVPQDIPGADHHRRTSSMSGKCSPLHMAPVVNAAASPK